MPSPFPGMDPYLEDPARWPDVHLSLIAALKDTLNARLDRQYVARSDERVYVTEDEEDVIIRPDVAVLGRGPARGAPGTPVPGASMVPIVVPTVIAEEHRENFIKILSRNAPEGEDLVTVIEILSPTNKRGDASVGRKRYLSKRRHLLNSTAHLVEVDLLRGGRRVPMATSMPKAAYYVIVSHRGRRPKCDVFPIGVRDRLPVFPIPLRNDEYILIDLQELVSSVYDKGRYEFDYSRAPVPPLDPDDVAWAHDLVKGRSSRP